MPCWAGWALAWAFALAPRASAAQPGPGRASATLDGQAAEQRLDGQQALLEARAAELRARLERLAREIQALKRGSRTVREDYRLRELMAESEEVGRRLNEAEARLGPRPVVAAESAPLPSALPTDGPRELAAKADILLDQAARFARQADALEVQVVRAQTRESLRRGMRRMESDPFLAMEATNRNLALSTRSLAQGDQGAPRTPPTDGRGPEYQAWSPPEPGGQAPSTGAPSTGGVTAPPVGGATAAPPAPSGDGAAGGERGTTGAQGAFIGGDVPSGQASVAAPVVPAQLRALLDQQTLSEVRRLERLGTPAARAEALRKAVEALRTQAEALQREAARLRAGDEKSR